MGITQDPENKNYLIVFDEKCKKCKNICYACHFEQNFGNWTSGNNDIDEFIQYTQLSAHNNVSEALEWIPYNKFYNIKYITEEELNKVYRANWIDGHIRNWDNENKNWRRYGSMFVALKSLNNSENATLRFINEV